MCVIYIGGNARTLRAEPLFTSQRLRIGKKKRFLVKFISGKERALLSAWCGARFLYHKLLHKNCFKMTYII